MHPNRLVAEALAATIRSWPATPPIAAKCATGRTRAWISCHGDARPPCWLEVKNCHLRRTGALAEFPTASPPAR